MAEEIETFVVDGEPLSPAWIDFGYRWPRVVSAGELGAVEYVPRAAFEAVTTERDKLRAEQLEAVALDIEAGRIPAPPTQSGEGT